LSDIFTKENIIIDSCLISIVSVKLSRDIKVATVYLSIYNTRDDLHTQEVYKKIIKQKKILRYKMGSMLESKYVPDLRFQLDLSLKNYDDINKLLKQ